MADRMLFISWGETVRGREERALEVFNEAVGMYGRMQQDGRIARFDVRLLMPNGLLGGYFELEGTPEQLAAVKEDDGFRRNMADASLIVDEMNVVEGFCNQGIADQMTLYTEAIRRVPQHA